jgi:hypothetical protein
MEVIEEEGRRTRRTEEIIGLSRRYNIAYETTLTLGLLKNTQLTITLIPCLLPPLLPALSPVFSPQVCAKKFIVIVDDSKMVPGLGVTGAMPVEITPFCHEHTQRTILELPGVKGAATGKLRMDGDKPYVTDNDNYIVDLYYTDPIADVKAVARALEGVVGVVEHGFFLDMTTAVIVAGKEGIEVINKK